MIDETQEITPQDHEVTVVRDDGKNAEEEAKRSKDMIVREFLTSAKSNWEAAKSALDVQHRRSLEEVEFDSGKHWDPVVYKERTGKDRVCLEVNRTPQYLNQVANDEKLTKPTIKVKPIGNADQKTAVVEQGLIRSCERRSDAQAIRDDAFYRMLQKGWAYWRVNVEWEGEDSWKQVLRTRRIYNDFAVFPDPGAREPDKSDARYYFLTEDMSKNEFLEEYPDAELCSLDWNSPGNDYKDWISADGKSIRIAEYFYTVKERVRLFKLPDGSGVFEDEADPDQKLKFVADEEDGQPMWRWSFRKKIYWCKFNGGEILDGNKDKTAGRLTLDSMIPIIFMGGRKIMVEGREIYVGMVRDAMEPCLASDYWMSAITEMVALGPKAPYLAAAAAIKGYETEWSTANIENYAVLHWNHMDESGNVIPQPQRNFGEPAIQAMTFLLRYADEDLKRVMGIYNAALGAPGPESSGVAIRSRQSESDVANYHFHESLSRAIAYEAKCYLSLMRKVYDGPQVVEITHPDNKVEAIKINEEFKNKAGKTVKYDMTDRNYATEVEIGPSYNTQRQEAAANMTEYLKIDPSAAPFVGDLIARNQDFPDKDEFERRLKARVPKEVREDSLGEQGLDIPPQFKVMYEDQARALEMATQQLQQVTQVIESKQLEFQHEKELKQMDLMSKKDSSDKAAETAVTVAAMQHDLAETKGLLQMLLARTEAALQPAPAATGV